MLFRTFISSFSSRPFAWNIQRTNREKRDRIQFRLLEVTSRINTGPLALGNFIRRPCAGHRMKFLRVNGSNGTVMSEKTSIQVGTGQIHIETGKLAKQADGAVTLQLGETIVFVAAVAATNVKPGQDFFPLTVDYREKAAAAGRFPGGYFKREGRPTEKEILTCRMIDRPIRPLFPKGWYNEVQVQSILLSADGENDPDILSIIGASAALMVSDIPWAGPLGAARIGRVKGQFVANPTHAQMAESDLDLVYVGNEKELVMFEGAAKEISEADFNTALQFGHDSCQPIIAAQKELARRAGKTKRAIVVSAVPDEILHAAGALAGGGMGPRRLAPGKLRRAAVGPGRGGGD